jgi:hypothetical protein
LPVLGGESPRDLVERIRQGEGERITWDELLQRTRSARLPALR